MRRWTQPSPIARHSSQPSTDSGSSVTRTWSRCAQPAIRADPNERSASGRPEEADRLRPTGWMPGGARSSNAYAPSGDDRRAQPQPVRQVVGDERPQLHAAHARQLGLVGDLLDPAGDDDAPADVAGRLDAVDLERRALREQQRRQLRAARGAEDHRPRAVVIDVVDRADDRRPAGSVDREAPDLARGEQAQALLAVELDEPRRGLGGHATSLGRPRRRLIGENY